MLLTKAEIQLLLEKLAESVVSEFDGYKVVRYKPGYSDDDKICKLQGKLSVMLQAAAS